MQPDDDFASLATVPVVFASAVYAIIHLAKLKKHERILIQSASGGLGIAALQIARYIGAEVSVTVGTSEKAAFLVKTHSIDKNHVLVSRGLPADLGEATAFETREFDVILSTSAGDAMFESWRCIAPRGRFIDLGRMDAMSNRTLPMEVFKRNATFSSFDLVTLVHDCPELGAQ